MARTQPSAGSDVLLYFVAILLPPVPVFIKRGCAADFWISIALTILGHIPGIIYAFYIISKYERAKTGNASASSVPPAAQSQHYGATNQPPMAPQQQAYQPAPVGGNKY